MSAPRLLSLSILMCVAAACQRGSVPVVPDKVVGHCFYMNRFSELEECRDYVGEWTEKDAAEDCEDQDSKVILGSACGVEQRLGYCFLGGEDERWERITFPGTDAQKCGSMKRGCELFVGGVFDPAPTCGGKGEEGGGDSGLPTFPHPVPPLLYS